jgi:Ran GTPase-activating protein (RanGAP) involved in mRNA processing and transport
MSGNNIGDVGIRIMAMALNQRNNLEKLNISSCKFSAKGAYSLF